MYNRKSINSLFNRLISVFVVFALFIGIFPAFVAGAFSIFSEGSNEIVKKLSAGLNTICKKVVKGVVSLFIDLYNETINYAIDNIGSTAAVKVESLPSRPFVSSKGGGGRMVLTRA